MLADMEAVCSPHQVFGSKPLKWLTQTGSDTLAGIWELLPPDLMQSERMPVDPPEVVEVGFAEQQLAMKFAGWQNNRPAESTSPRCAR